jgi:hypothetical protein
LINLGHRPWSALPIPSFCCSCQHHCCAGNSSSSFDSSSNDEDRIWSQLAFPSYLQSKNKHKPEVCRDFEKAVTAAEHKQARHALAASVESYDEEEDEEWEPETVWHTIR